MKSRILSELQSIEAREDVRVLYACESGSRAWGMDSADSDYDVRFLYAHRPEWYLSLEPGRDVIERPIDDELDISGWDLRKALVLFGRSNPTLLEWLQSPVVYAELPAVVEPLRALVPTVYARERVWHHYSRASRSFWRRYAAGEGTLKTFFYALRTTLAATWVLEREAPPPMTLPDLADAMLPRALHPDLQQWLQVKRAGREKVAVVVSGPLWEFVQVQQERLAAAKPHFHRTWAPMDQLNVLFRRFLDEVWGEA